MVVGFFSLVAKAMICVFTVCENIVFSVLSFGPAVVALRYHLHQLLLFCDIVLFVFSL